MVFVFPTRIHPPPSLVVVRQGDHQIWQGIHIHHHRRPAIFTTTTTRTILLFRRRTSVNSRRWDSNAETFRTRNYDFDSDDDFEVADDTNEWLDILEDFVDGVWIFKAFRSFGWMLPAIISSFLLTSGPKAFLMALAVPIGQSALSMLFQTVWGRPKSKTKRHGKSKRRPQPRANSRVDIDDDEQEEYVKKEDRKRASGGYQTWVTGDGSNGKKTNKSFGGWEELDGRGNRNANWKTSKSKISKRDRRSETPLLLRLLIAVFPFLGSWTKML